MIVRVEVSRIDREGGGLPWLRFASGARWVAWGIAVVILGGIGFVPLFGGPGYESALAAGLVLPTIAALVSSWEVACYLYDPYASFARGVKNGLTLACLGLVVCLLHGVKGGFCDPAEGIFLFAFGGGFGAIMGGAWGATAGIFVLGSRRPKILGCLIALLGPVMGVLISLARFYTSPMVFAFDPFFGYFSGPLYDTVIGGLTPLLTYRCGSVASLGAAALIFSQLMRDRNGKLVFCWRGQWGLVGLSSLFALTSLGILVEGARLGHFSTAASIRSALGRSVVLERCEVVYSRALHEREAMLVARECTEHLRELESWLGVNGPPSLTVYLFSSSTEKGALMGASRTQIAKPWRAEVYIQSAPYPHPVLRHELAHVVAGAVGVGPFRVSGPLGGWIPDPGRIEGVAEAAAPDDDADLSLDEWARAMLALDALPPLRRVFRLGFLAENASKAYTVAGSFTLWLRGEYGSSAIRRWYGGESVELITSASWETLERRWHAHLLEIPVSEQVLQTARLRFERPAIFGRRCPRVVDRWMVWAGTELANGRPLDARSGFEEVLKLDPFDFGARMGVGTCDVRSNEVLAAREVFAGLSRDRELVSLQRANADERLADLELASGHVPAAVSRYARLEAQVVDEDHLRTLELKRATANDAQSRKAIVSLLIGAPGTAPDLATAAALLGEWSASRPDDGTPEYLLARSYFVLGKWEEAEERLDKALSRTIPLPRIRREALRIRLLLACARGERPAILRALTQWKAEGEIAARSSLVAGMRALARRCGSDARTLPDLL